MPRMLLRPNKPPIGESFDLNNRSMQAVGLLACWPHFDPGGSSLRELVNGRDAVMTATGATRVGSPVVGRAVAFDGSSGAASAAVDISGTSQLTVTFWMIAPGATAGCQLLEYTANFNNANAWIVYCASATSLVSAMAASVGGVKGRRDATIASAAASWHHYAATFDRSLPSGQVGPVYQDGLPVSTSLITDLDAGPTFANSTVYWASRAANSFFAQSQFADVRLYRRVLSPQEIFQIYAPQTRWELYRPAKCRVIVQGVTGDVTATPAAVTLALSAPTPTAPSIVFPPAVVVSLAEPSATPVVTVLPSVVSIASVVLTPGINVVVLPAVVAISLVLPNPEVGGNISVTPTLIALVLAEPAATPVIVVLPGVVALAIGLQAPSITSDAVVVPDPVAVTVAEPTPTPAIAVLPGTITLVLGLDAASVGGGAAGLLLRGVGH